MTAPGADGHSRTRRGIAGALAGATLFGALGYPAMLSAETRLRPLDLGALPASPATGPRVPAPLNPQLDGTFPVSSSTSPTLVWDDVPAGVGQVTFRVTSLASRSPETIWQSTVAVGADRVARARVPNGRLEQGTTYGWAAQATSTAGATHGPFQMTIDSQRAGAQPATSFAGLQVAQATGELIYNWAGPALPALSGSMGWGLGFRASNVPQPGVPTGWSLAVSGSTPWKSLEANADGSVTLLGNSGSAVSYTQQGGDQWRPAIGRYHSAGTATRLTQNDDGTFSATDGNRTVTVFGAPSPDAPSHPTRVWTLGAPTIQQSWKNGRLSTITDPVTGNTTSFFYGGDAPCASDASPGFITAPDGQLCGVIDWAGNAAMLEYVATPTGPQVGRIAVTASKGAAVEDLAYDAAGRLAAVRKPVAAAAIAAGVIPGLGAGDPRVTTQVSYDADGRVKSITGPAGLVEAANQPADQAGRAQEQFTYAPFTVKATGVSAPVGALEQVWIDRETLLPTKARNESGNVTTWQYDAKGNATRTTDEMSGTVVTSEYDAQGRPVGQVGPTRGSLDSPSAPRNTTHYDQDERGRPWTGMATQYWANADFKDAPSGGTTGPVPPGGTSAVSSLQMNWPGSPVGDGPWAARLTGTYVAPADGTYVFANGTSAQMWVNGSLCQPQCTLPMKEGGSTPIQLDVTAPNGGAAGINATVIAPGKAKQPIPTSALRPGYNLPTSTTTREAVAGAGLTTLTTKSVYNPTTTQLVATVSPSGGRISRTYEPYDPANGQWGRSTGLTDAGGRTTTPTYYGVGQKATDCTGREIPQQGGVATTTLPGGATVSQVGTIAGGALKTESAGITVCGGASADGKGVTATTSGNGPEVSTTTVQGVDGDPLVASTTVTSQGVSSTNTTEFDTNGNVYATTDSHGTRTVTYANPYTEKVERVTQVTAKGQERDVRYTYAPGGDVATITVNGHLLLTNDYAADGTPLRTRLANGAVQQFELDANNTGRKTTTTFPDGTVLGESAVHSPTGRLLERTVTGPSGSSTYKYGYNPDGRLVSTTLDGAIPVTQKAWASEYSGAAGKAGNREQLVTTMADGSTAQKTFTYGPDDRVTSVSTGRAQGDVQYDDAGRVTKLGRTSMEYDAAGHLLKASDATRTYAFTDNGDTTTFTEVQNGATRTVTATQSGQNLVLGADGLIDGQVMSLAGGVSVLLGADGAPARWVYDDMLGNATWSSRQGAVPTKTQLYNPDGREIGVQRLSDPRTPIDLMTDSLGWANSHGAGTLRLETPVITMGSRTYSSSLGRFLQPDTQVGGSLNAYEYAIGDPINLADPTGHTPGGWIVGAIVATVVGTAIGALTFGIGVGAVAAYGAGAISMQIAVGAVAGAASGFASELAAQLIVNGASGIDWASIGIATGIGAGIGAVSAGLAGFQTKIDIPARHLRALTANTPRAMKTASPWDGYAAMRAKVVANGDEVPGLWKSMWTKDSWAKQRAAVRAKSKATFTMDDLLEGRAGSGRVIGSGTSSSSSSSSSSLASKKLPSASLSSGTIDDATSLTEEMLVGSMQRPGSGGAQRLASHSAELDDLYENAFKQAQRFSGAPDEALRGSGALNTNHYGQFNDYITSLFKN